jgi:hypothetical protein
MLIIPKSRNINNSTICSDFLNINECNALINNKKKVLDENYIEKFSYIINYVNGNLYKFVINDIQGFDIVKLDKNTEINKNWQIDLNDKENGNLRKLSLIIFLSEEKSYHGGKIIFDPMSDDFVQSQGTLIIFPAFFNYRFEPVTDGQLILMKAWAYGPSFR